MSFDKFLHGYITCALWSSTDNSDEQGGQSLDANYSADDIAPQTVTQMEDDCRKFYDEFNGMFRYKNIKSRIDCTANEYAGHDFWLTRNHHGTGFWDSWTEPYATVLTNASHKYSECDLYVGDDGKLYL